jgi:hypothetical protein
MDALKVSDGTITVTIGFDKIPVENGIPKTGFFPSPYTYIGTVVWTETVGGTPLNGSFAVETPYTATVTLKPAAGYTFASGGLSVTHAGASPTSTTFEDGGEGTRGGSITFPATGRGTEISGPIDLADHIPGPVENGIPKTGFFPSPYTYNGTVVWTETVGGTPLNGSFAVDTPYTATVTLTAISGYTFADGVTVTYGEEELDALKVSDGTITVTIGFDKIPVKESDVGLEMGWW